MKITAVEPMLIDRYLFVQVHTDEGLVGVGESGTWGHLEASEAALRKFGDYLVGQDPSRIEHHWNVMYRSGHFRGAAIMGGISAVGHLNPFLDEERSATYFQTHAAKIGGAIEAVRRYREALGDDVDICL